MFFCPIFNFLAANFVFFTKCYETFFLLGIFFLRFRQKLLFFTFLMKLAKTFLISRLHLANFIWLNFIWRRLATPIYSLALIFSNGWTNTQTHAQLYIRYQCEFCQFIFAIYPFAGLGWVVKKS